MFNSGIALGKTFRFAAETDKVQKISLIITEGSTAVLFANLPDTTAIHAGKLKNRRRIFMTKGTKVT